MNIAKHFDKKIQEEVNKILTKTKFPDYDDICTDTLAEIIDRLIIVHIRYWYLEDAMSEAKSDEELANLRRKSESLFKEKRPMLIKAFDKTIIKMLEGKIKYKPESLKYYKNWEEKK